MDAALPLMCFIESVAKFAQWSLHLTLPSTQLVWPWEFRQVATFEAMMQVMYSGWTDWKLVRFYLSVGDQGTGGVDTFASLSGSGVACVPI